MIDFIKNLVKEAQASENHTAVKCMSHSDLMDAMKMSNNSFVDFCKEMSEYMKNNGCSFSYIEEGMMPVIKVMYKRFESDCIFDGAKFGKVYVTREWRKALYIEKVGDEHKLYIENVGISYHNSDGTYKPRITQFLTMPGISHHNSDGTLKSFSELYDSETTKEYSECDIIAEWNESINEKELHTLAEENNPYEFYRHYEFSDEDDFHTIFNNGFKMGYRKAKGQ